MESRYSVDVTGTHALSPTSFRLWIPQHVIKPQASEFKLLRKLAGPCQTPVKMQALSSDSSAQCGQAQSCIRPLNCGVSPAMSPHQDTRTKAESAVRA